MNISMCHDVWLPDNNPDISVRTPTWRRQCSRDKRAVFAAGSSASSIGTHVNSLLCDSIMRCMLSDNFYPETVPGSELRLPCASLSRLQYETECFDLLPCRCH